MDKTFAPDRKSAEKIFAHAEANDTKCYSSSDLRFSTELSLIDKEKIYSIHSEGPGTYEMYSIHQIEPIVCLMQCRAKEVMFTGSESHPAMTIRFEDGRCAYMHQSMELKFRLSIDDKDNNGFVYEIESDFFALFIKNLVEFFKKGEVPVEHSQTIDVIAIREAGLKAMKTPFEWVQV